VALETYNGRTGAGLGPDQAWTTAQAGYVTGSNTAGINTASVEAVERMEVDLGSDDMSVEIVFADTPSAGYGDVGICMRQAASSVVSPARYCVKRGSTGGFLTGFYQIRRYNGGGISDFVYLVNTTALVFSGATEVFRVEVEGSTIRVYQNSSLINTIVDSAPAAITTGHYAGIDGFRSNLNASTTVRVDTFEAELIGGGPAPVDEITGSLALEIDLSGALDAPTAIVPGLVGALGLLVDLGGILDAPIASVPSVTANLPLNVDLGGSLDPPTASVPSLTGDLAFEVDLTGDVSGPGVTVPSVAGALSLTLTLAGALVAPTATVGELSGALALIVDLDGFLTDLGVISAPNRYIVQPETRALIVQPESRAVNVPPESHRQEATS